jgi:hypothetical protein
MGTAPCPLEPAEENGPVLRVLFVDLPHARWTDIPGGDHANPPAVMALADTDQDALGRPGAYRTTGEEQDGRWVYVRDDEDGAASGGTA